MGELGIFERVDSREFRLTERYSRKMDGTLDLFSLIQSFYLDLHFVIIIMQLVNETLFFVCFR